MTKAALQSLKCHLEFSGYIIVVTDANGFQYLRTNNRKVLRISGCGLNDYLGHCCFFPDKEYAELALKETEQLTKYEWIADPPFKAEVVPLSFKIG